MVQFDENGSAKSEAPVGETERNLEVTNNMVMEASSASRGEIQLKKVEDFKEECEGTPSPLDKRKASGLKIETTPARKQSTKRKKTVNDCSIEDTEYELEAQENPVPLENRMDNLKLGTLLDTNEDALMARGLTSGTSLGDIESRHQLFDYSPTHVRTRNGNGNGNGDFPTWERQQSQNLSISDVPDTVALRRANSGLLSQAKRINQLTKDCLVLASSDSPRDHLVRRQNSGGAEDNSDQQSSGSPTQLFDFRHNMDRKTTTGGGSLSNLGGHKGGFVSSFNKKNTGITSNNNGFKSKITLRSSTFDDDLEVPNTRSDDVFL
jgi:hypothetical protein